MKKELAILSALLLLSLIVGGCSSQVGEGFAIYLTRNNIPVSQMAALSHFELADTPFISANDIISYTWATHGIQLTPEAYERVEKLEVPTSGKSFVVCVDKAPVYWGAFWAGYSSQSFDGITINVKPVIPVENAPFSFKIWLGYPSPSFFQGEDPRSNPAIMESLEQAGKLK